MTQAGDIVDDLGTERYVRSIGIHVIGVTTAVTASHADKLNRG